MRLPQDAVAGIPSGADGVVFVQVLPRARASSTKKFREVTASDDPLEVAAPTVGISLLFNPDESGEIGAGCQRLSIAPKPAFSVKYGCDLQRSDNTSGALIGLVSTSGIRIASGDPAYFPGLGGGLICDAELFVDLGGDTGCDTSDSSGTDDRTRDDSVEPPATDATSASPPASAPAGACAADPRQGVESVSQRGADCTVATRLTKDVQKDQGCFVADGDREASCTVREWVCTAKVDTSTGSQKFLCRDGDRKVRFVLQP